MEPFRSHVTLQTMTERAGCVLSCDWLVLTDAVCGLTPVTVPRLTFPDCGYNPEGSPWQQMGFALAFCSIHRLHHGLTTENRIFLRSPNIL